LLHECKKGNKVKEFREEYISPYCMFIDKGKQVTYVIFSSIQTPEGKFSFYHFGKTVDANVVFVNTHDANWYFSGIMGLGVDFVSTVDGLNCLLTRFQNCETIFIGGSMGAYAAVLYGSVVENVQSILAFGPELELGIDFGLSKNHLKNTFDNSYNIYEVMKPNKIKYYFLFGEFFPVDMLGANRLWQKFSDTVMIISLKNLVHDLPQFIDKEYSLIQFIPSILSGKVMITPDIIGTLSYDYSLINFMYKTFNNLHIDEDEIIFFKNNIEKYDNTSASYIYYCLGKIYLNRNLIIAKKYLISAIDLNPKNINFYYELVALTVLLNEQKDRVQIAKKALENYTNDMIYQGSSRFKLLRMIDVLLNNKQSKEVLKFCLTKNIETVFPFQYKLAIERECNELHIS